MKKKVFLTRAIHEFALKKLKKRYSVEVHSGKIPIPEKKLQTKIAKVEGLVCFPYDKINREMLDRAKNLKVISTYSVGFDHIDTEYAKKKKIRIGYTPEVLTDATADLAFGLILDISRRITEGDRTIRDGSWKVIYGAFDYVGTDLQNKTLGIIGLGRIGTALVKRAKAFGMNVTYYSRTPISKNKEKTLGVKYLPFEKLVSQSDIISIHVPHTTETENMFDMKIFKKMKDSSFLINTSRGKVVNQKCLVQALKKKIIAGAGLDVFETEPIDKSNPLTKIDNVVIVPHIGSSTKETRAKMAEITVKNLILGMNGRKLDYSVGY